MTMSSANVIHKDVLKKEPSKCHNFTTIFCTVMHKRDVYSLITIDTSVCVKSDLGLSGWFTITVSIVESKSPSLSLL